MKALKRAFEFFLFIAILPVFFIIGLFVFYAKDLPQPEFFSERVLAESTKIYDRTGNVLLYEIFEEEKRSYVPLEKIPKHLRDAIIASEDVNFYSHKGIDIRGIFRAILEDLKLRRLSYGGSTISQQLVRSTFLSNEKSIARKTREIILSLELDFKYPKDQILEWYLNQIPFGENAYGVEAAAQIYFGKSVSEISLAESAVLAAMIKAPYVYTPATEEGKERLKKRKEYVLNRMVETGFITQKEAEEAKAQEMRFVEKKKEFFAPYFVLWIKSILEAKYGKEALSRMGLKVYTSLDVTMQKIAEEEVREGIKRNKKYGAYNSGLVAIDPRNGEVLAMAVGTGNYDEKPQPEGCTPGKDCKFDPKVNVVFSPRQPGSAFKPFVYATAFSKGYSDTTVVVDELTDFGVWGGSHYVPMNYDGRFRGPVTLREALAQSLNIPAVKVILYLAGLEDSINFAKECGISTLKPPYGPSIVLGGWEVKLFEMVFCYGVFATGGYKVTPNPILKILDNKGEVIYKAQVNKTRILKEDVASLITDILSDNEARAPIFGYSSPLYFPQYKVAVKTGTTQNYRDGWTIGYVPSLAVGVWSGNNDNSPTFREPGVVLSGPIFHRFLERVLPNREFNSF